MVQRAFYLITEAFLPYDILEIACLIYVVKNLFLFGSWLLKQFMGVLKDGK